MQPNRKDKHRTEKKVGIVLALGLDFGQGFGSGFGGMAVRSCHVECH